MTDFIYQNKDAISKELCNEMIKLYDSVEEGKFEGCTFGGVQKDIKDTTDFLIAHTEDQESKWYYIERMLYSALQINLVSYIEYINRESYVGEGNNGQDGQVLKNRQLQAGNFMMQKYEKGKGKYTYHHDFRAEYENKQYRAITYLFYLNDVTEGGETEFWDYYKIIPEAGKLVFFPATWCYPHRGRMPVSHDKYIITGWFYLDN